jgi:nitrate/nitrite transport system substrate-binding protein
MTDRAPTGFSRRLLMGGSLAALAAAAAGCSPKPESGAARPVAGPGSLEKDTLKLGFIKLTDMAPLAVAKELGYFEDEGLYVTLEPQANWKVLLDRVISGELDGAHMLAGQPIAATIGFGTKADIVTPFSMDRNGNAITVANKVWAAMKKNIPTGPDGKPVHPISATALKPVVEAYRARGEAFNMGMVFPVSTHNYELRYWLAAGGLNPGYYSPDDVAGQTQAQVLLSVTPPPQMPATLEAGTILGYCVGEPWNQQAVFKGIGVPVVTDDEIWKDNPEKVFGLTRAFAQTNPKTVTALTKALIRAGIWLDADNGANRQTAVTMLAKPEYVGADAAVIANSMTGFFEYEKGDKRPAPDFNVFFRGYATYPYYSDAIWYLTQMRRWGQIPQSHDDAWFVQTAKQVYRPDLYLAAAKALVDGGQASKADFPWDSDGFRAPTSAFIDKINYDARKPNAYLQSLKIGLKTGEAVVGGKIVNT